MPDNLIIIPTVERFNQIHTDAMELFARKNADYGDTWRELGAEGVFVRWSDKRARLKTLLWDKKAAQVRDEPIRDTMRDAYVYNLMMIVLLDDAITERMERIKP